MISSLHWLLINLAVVASGTPVTRYATFKNLDMSSSCHVGVLAKDKAGTTWVIQSKNNGTYSMTWDEYTRKWGTNKIKIYEWIYSVDGTTLEGAVAFGNINNDELLDKCYEVRDAVVGYLSGRNDSLNILTAQTCPPSKRYCGHDPEVQVMISIGHSQRQKILLTCGDDGRVARVDICDRNCASNRDKVGHARCQCSPNRRYCGYELTSVGGWLDYDSHILYLCLDEINISIIERCSNGCVAMKDNSICSGYCTPNNSYCGWKLLEMGLKGYDPRTVYKCQPNGRSANSTLTCPEACMQSSGRARCQCHPGRLYCAHELITQLNWWWISNEKQPIDPHKLGHCLPDKGTVTWSFNCINCTASQGENDGYCQWIPGVFCGRMLNAMGWTGHENDILYQCGEEARNANIISMCLSGTCQGNGQSCKCIPNRSYCGHQLHLMGWTQFVSEKIEGLIQCKEDGTVAEDFTRCKKCTNSGEHARCAACMESERYCGHELLYDPPYDANSIYYCNDQRNATLIKTCMRTCARIRGNNNLANPSMIPWCLGECKPGETYCGSRLFTLGYTSYNNNSLYSCIAESDGQRLTTVETCSSGCTTLSEKQSICSRSCAPNRSYCGWQLLGMGFKGYDSKVVYRCEASGQLAITIANCSEGCVEADDGYACYCHPGRTYCVHELVTQLNWWLPNDNSTRPHQTMICLPEKISGRVSYNCRTCIASQGEKNAYCQWTPGVNCGRDLNDMGWPGYENDTLYQCGKEEKNTSIISMCPNGTCKGSSCPSTCIPKRTYCGHQLYLMGYSWFESDMTQMLWQCEKDGKSVERIADCKRCTNSEGHARCVCKDTQLYCGHELDAHLPYGDNALYRCNNEGGASFFMACKRSCVRVESEPLCQGECLPGETYCGSRILRLGFTGYNISSIYSCSTDGSSFNDDGWVDSLCTHCIPGQSYCGHHLRQNQYIPETTLQWRYECQRDGSFKSVMPCYKCIDSSSGAYCQCIPGQFFCGMDVNKYMRWNDYVETFRLHSSFTDDTLFRCNQQHKIEFVEQCPNQQCMSPFSLGISYCLCTPHRTYCGHQLNHRYNLLDTDLSLNFIYQCSENQTQVVPIRKCDNTCVSVNGDPRCRQLCIHGSRYCGSDLIRLEGWTAFESNVLYQCTNGSFASPEMNCTQGCRGKTGDVDAYCLGMPTPWYWILMATGLPLLFISLCVGLIRTIIKHRRLQKFVHQHRINTSQLILAQKLGHGQFGEVWQSRYTDSSGQQMDVAVKISKHHLNTNDGQNLASANCFFQESVALDFLRHQNITRALGICSNLKMAGGITTPALVLEYMDGGNSADYILREREHLVASDLIRIFIDICQAGEHLQKMGVLHRDIGARNVLIRKHPRNAKPVVAKLTDFGLAKDVGKAGLYRSTNPDRAMFHEGYTAPEGFRGEFSSQSDVWSFGVFMWELYMMMDRNQNEPVAPYSDIPSRDILVHIGNGHRLRRPHMASTETYSTMTSCWTWKPESRPTFSQLLKILKAKRTRNGVELDVEMEPHGVDLVAGGGEQREEETAFSEKGASSAEYASPRL